MTKPDQFIPLNHMASKELEFQDREGPSDPQDSPDHKDFPDPEVKLENQGSQVSQDHVDFQDQWDHQALTVMTV